MKKNKKQVLQNKIIKIVEHRDILALEMILFVAELTKLLNSKAYRANNPYNAEQIENYKKWCIVYYLSSKKINDLCLDMAYRYVRCK